MRYSRATMEHEHMYSQGEVKKDSIPDITIGVQKLPLVLEEVYLRNLKEPRQLLSQQKAKLNWMPKGYWQFYSNGLTIDIGTRKAGLYLPTEKEPVLIPEGTSLGQIDFTPFGPSTYQKGRTYTALSKAATGLKLFLTAIDMSKPDRLPTFCPPTYLYGTTNLRMAEVAKHVGFQATKRHQQGQNLFIYAPVEAVRENLQNLEQKGVLARLNRLAQHEADTLTNERREKGKQAEQ